jgi:hypothetical protein
MCVSRKSAGDYGAKAPQSPCQDLTPNAALMSPPPRAVALFAMLVPTMVVPIPLPVHGLHQFGVWRGAHATEISTRDTGAGHIGRTECECRKRGSKYETLIHQLLLINLTPSGRHRENAGAAPNRR